MITPNKITTAISACNVLLNWLFPAFSIAKAGFQLLLQLQTYKTCFMIRTTHKDHNRPNLTTNLGPSLVVASPTVLTTPRSGFGPRLQQSSGHTSSAHKEINHNLQSPLRHA